ncbi:hypothetical protein C6A85_18945, partial [Mycobacterium sp. ITM-2017-0098]
MQPVEDVVEFGHGPMVSPILAGIAFQQRKPGGALLECNSGGAEPLDRGAVAALPMRLAQFLFQDLASGVAWQ